MSSASAISLSEENSPLSITCSGKLQLQLTNTDQQTFWGIVNRSIPIEQDTSTVTDDESVRQKFVWQKGRLELQKELLMFEDRYFPTKEAAIRYADETGYTTQQIQAIPMQNARLKITDEVGGVQYLQLPVRASGKNSIVIDGKETGFDGELIISATDNGLQLCNLVSMEDYVAGVVPNEIGNNAPMEALKTQAVTARTHALSLLLMNRHLGDGYDLCCNTHCQVYKGKYLVDTAIIKSVTSTADSVMLYNNYPADAVYHSSCGGKTEANQNAWNGKPIAFLQGVTCHPQADSLDLTLEENSIQWLNMESEQNGMSSWEKRSEEWSRSISRATLEMNSGVHNPRYLRVLRRGVSGRILRLKISGDSELNVEGEFRIRKVFGGLPSSFFYISNGILSQGNVYTLNSEIKIIGKGFGHGVGLCQVGALQKARNGWVWHDIVSSYYPGVSYSADWLPSYIPTQHEEDN